MWGVRRNRSTPEEHHLRNLAELRRVRDRIDREYAQPLDVEALARGAHMSAGHLSREFRCAYGESPYSFLMTRRIERAMALLRRGDLSVTEVCFAVGLLVTGHLQHSLYRVGRYAAQHLPAPGGTRNGGNSVVCGETGDPTDQESRSAGRRAALSVTAMDITIHTSSLPHTDPEASMAFYREHPRLRGPHRRRIRRDALDHGRARRPADTCILLAPPAVDPGITDDERRMIAEMMAKGTYGWILLATKDLDGAFERVQGQRRRDRPGADRAAVRRSRLRDPRSRGQPDPHPAAVGSTQRVKILVLLPVRLSCSRARILTP